MKLPNEINRSYDPIWGALDITGAGAVEIKVSGDKKMIWVNVDGLCVLRICQIIGPVEVIEYMKIMRKKVSPRG